MTRLMMPASLPEDRVTTRPVRPVVVLLSLMLTALPAAAQELPASLGGRAGSIGQPNPLQWTGLLAMGRDGGTHVMPAFGLQRDLLSPMLSALAVHGEVYARATDDDVSAGMRARLLSPFARVGIGMDYRPADGPPQLLLSVFHPVRRGGLFADGSMLRVDVLPARSQGVAVGVEKPLFRSHRVGRSRPRRDHVRLPAGGTWPAAGAPDPAVAAQLAIVAAAAHNVRLAVLPLGPIPRRHASEPARIAGEIQELQTALAAMAHRDAAHGGAASHSEAEVRRYHRALEHAFALAAATGHESNDIQEEYGSAAAAAARRILLDDVLLPYNRLLGQTRRPDRLTGLAARAYTAFERWLHSESSVVPSRHDAVMRVFGELLGIMESNRAALRAQWRDDRFVWLPLQYALLPEDHDTQAKLDALIEHAVDARFTDGNFVSYVVNEQFQYQLSRTIREANEYHVLWTHDFRGSNTAGMPDGMSYRHVLGSYLAAMTQRVQDYDRTGVFPAYIIVLDQWFYEVNRGRLWLTLLEDPLGHRLQLPAEYRTWQDSIALAQHALRAAVAASATLQAETRRHGTAWLRDLIKVHVNITNPADPSFWSTGVLRGLPLPDNMMRDHRKVVFYDLTEADPYAGEAMFTGAGVGEHYANLSWEDRSLLVRGPAVLPLKQEVRELLLAQGLPRDRLPHALLPRERGADHDARLRLASERDQQPLRALTIHNGAGFAQKDVNVVKAVLYTMMPPGSVITIPDSLWNSDFWGSLLLGCALRGGRVVMIAPAAPNAPADAFGTLGRSRELLARLVGARNLLAAPISDAGGTLGIGIYDTSLEVTDIPEKVRLVNAALSTDPWLRSLFDFPQSVLDELDVLAATISGLAMAPDPFAEFAYDPQPKLHLKANFLASAEAWTLMNRSEWAAAAWAYMQIRVNQVQMRAAAVQSFETFAEAIADVGGGMVEDWYASLDEATRERVVFYTLMGSHNQNNRSIVIDAEVGFLTSRWPAIIPHIDLITIMGQAHWIDEPDDLAPLLPLDTGRKRWLAHWARLAL